MVKRLKAFPFRSEIRQRSLLLPLLLDTGLQILARAIEKEKKKERKKKVSQI
jgi:hypothetical protein